MLLLLWPSPVAGAEHAWQSEPVRASPAPEARDAREVLRSGGGLEVAGILAGETTRGAERPPTYVAAARFRSSPLTPYAPLVRTTTRCVVEPVPPLCEWLPYHANAPPA